MRLTEIEAGHYYEWGYGYRTNVIVRAVELKLKQPLYGWERRGPFRCWTFEVTDKDTRGGRIESVEVGAIRFIETREIKRPYATSTPNMQDHWVAAKNRHERAEAAVQIVDMRMEQAVDALEAHGLTSAGKMGERIALHIDDVEALLRLVKGAS